MYQKKCVHQAVTGLGKYVPQGLPTHVETVVLLGRKKVDGEEISVKTESYV